MLIDNIKLESIPRFPQCFAHTFYEEEKNCKKPNVEMLLANEKRLEVMGRNTKKLFTPQFLEEYERVLQIDPNNFQDLRLLGIICRSYGFELGKTKKRNRKVKILQIGCGPHLMHGNGPLIDEKLKMLGANVTNLDINDVKYAYSESKFIQGSWLDIDTIFNDQKFDIIFTNRMNPEFFLQISSYYKQKEITIEIAQNLDLIQRTMSRLNYNPHSMFLIAGSHRQFYQDFLIPEHVNDVIASLTSGIEYNYLHLENDNDRDSFTGTQVYKYYHPDRS